MIAFIHLSGAIVLATSSIFIQSPANDADVDPWGFPKSEEFRAQIEHWRTGPYLVEVIALAQEDHPLAPTLIQGAADGVWFVELRERSMLPANTVGTGQETLETFTWYITGPEQQIEVSKSPTRYQNTTSENAHRRVTVDVRDSLLPPRRRDENGELFLDFNATIHPTIGEKSQMLLFSPLSTIRGEIPDPVRWEARDGGTRVHFRFTRPGLPEGREASVSVYICSETGRVTQWGGAYVFAGAEPAMPGSFTHLAYDSDTSLIPIEFATKQFMGTDRSQIVRPIADPSDVTAEALKARIEPMHTDERMASLPDGTTSRVVTMQEARAFVAEVLGATP